MITAKIDYLRSGDPGIHTKSAEFTTRARAYEWIDTVESAFKHSGERLIGYEVSGFSKGWGFKGVGISERLREWAGYDR